MSLAEQWKRNPTELNGKTIEQIVSFAGNGILKDNSETSNEFREYISTINSAENFR